MYVFLPINHLIDNGQSKQWQRWLWKRWHTFLFSIGEGHDSPNSRLGSQAGHRRIPKDYDNSPAAGARSLWVGPNLFRGSWASLFFSSSGDGNGDEVSDADMMVEDDDGEGGWWRQRGGEVEHVGDLGGSGLDVTWGAHEGAG